MFAGEQRFGAFIRSFWRIPERIAPSDWIEKYITLPAGFNESDPGRVRLRRWMREIIDCLAIRGLVDILFSAPTQEGKTFLLRMCAAYKIAGRPAPAIWLDSTMPKGRSIVKKQIRPLVDTNPVLAARRPANPHHYTNTEMLFPGAAFNVYGANSENQVAGDTAECVFGNEAAKWRLSTEEEAAILELVRHRTERYGETRKHLFSSTPRTEGDLFWGEVEKGDMRRWFVPCPHCGHLQLLEWGDEYSQHGVKWDGAARRADGTWDLERVRTTARYRCASPACPGPAWDDAQRLAAIEDPRAHWRPTRDAVPGCRSYVLNGLYGRSTSRRLGNLAAKFLGARRTGFLVDRQDFWNSDMGEVWRLTIEEVNVKKLAHLERDYVRGTLPSGFRPDVVILELDVQRDRFRWVLRAFAWAGAGDSYLVDFGWAATWADLDQVEADYRGDLGGHWWAIIDMNFEDRRQEVREQVYARRHRHWVLADGVEYSAGELVKLERENIALGGKGGGSRLYVPRFVISTYAFKCELEARFTGKLLCWFLPRLDLLPEHGDVEEYADYKKELLDEQRFPRHRRARGLPAEEWRPRTKINHAFDCEVYGLALFWALRKRRTTKRRRQDAQSSRQVVAVERE
jgi:phage terminase large subunit GpA-like protein